MTVPPSLDSRTHETIKRLCAEGDSYLRRLDYDRAISRYENAWRLLPEPKFEWGAAAWILAAIGDACFLDGRFAAAVEKLQDAMRCPDAIGNPFLHLRLGESLLETGQQVRAMD
jgi:tetratricopeptide (TPR) repeat protein